MYKPISYEEWLGMSRLEYDRRVELDIAKIKKHLVGNKLVI